MSIWDIINPWGALRRARRRIDNCERAFVDRDAHLVLLDKKLAEAIDESDKLATKLLRCRVDNNRLNRLLASAHFRNPKTGRLGKKGETFQ